MPVPFFCSYTGVMGLSTATPHPDNIKCHPVALQLREMNMLFESVKEKGSLIISFVQIRHYRQTVLKTDRNRLAQDDMEKIFQKLFYRKTISGYNYLSGGNYGKAI